MRQILIVDDDATSLKLFEALLAEKAQCHAVSNGQAALDAYNASIKSKKPYSLILLDIVMPLLDGLKVLETIRKDEEERKVPKDKRIPIIIITAFEKMLTEKYTTLCDDVIAKPIYSDLVTKVENLLSKHS